MRASKSSNRTVYTKLARRWSQFKQPARPTKGDLKIFSDYLELIKRHGATKIAVLGATPELRDLGIKYNFETWAIDVNPMMIKAMERLMKNSNNRLNRSLVADWFKIPLPNNFFDAVLGEQSFNILAKKEFLPLYLQLKRLIKPQGYLIQKIQVYKPKLVNKNLAWFKKYLFKDNTPTGDLSLFIMQSKKYGVCNPQTYQIYTKREAWVIDDFLKRGLLSSKLWHKHEKEIGQLHRSPGPVLTVLPEEQADQLLKKYFTIIKKKKAKDMLMCQTMPIYLAQVKKK